MKKIIALVIALLLIIISYFAYQKYEANKFISLVTPHLKNTSLRVANQIGYKLEADTNITFKELFNKLEEDIAEMDKRALEIQTITTDKNESLSTAAVDYIKASQVLARSLLDYYRKVLAVSNTNDWARLKLDEFNASSGSYGSDFAEKSADKALTDARNALIELEKSIPDALKAAQSLKKSREGASKIYSDNFLVSIVKLDEIINVFTPNKEISHSNAPPLTAVESVIAAASADAAADTAAADAAAAAADAAAAAADAAAAATEAATKTAANEKSAKK